MWKVPGEGLCTGSIAEYLRTIVQRRFVEAGQGPATFVDTCLNLPEDVVAALGTEHQAEQPPVPEAFRRRDRVVEMPGPFVIVGRVLQVQPQARLQYGALDDGVGRQQTQPAPQRLNPVGVLIRSA